MIGLLVKGIKKIGRGYTRFMEYLVPDDSLDCQGCSLDSQWVLSDLEDHTCTRWKK